MVNIDAADKPAASDADLSDSSANPRRYWNQIAGFLTGQETYAIEATTDNNRLLFSNRYLDTTDIPPSAPIPSEAPPPGGVCELIIENDDPVATDAFNWAKVSNTYGTTKGFASLNLGVAFDTFDVNNANSMLVLPADSLKATIGSHPEYVFVGGYNRFISGNPSHDPSAFADTPITTAPLPGGSNIGVIRDGKLIAATLSIPFAAIDNMAFASGKNYLFAGMRGIGSVFAYNVVNLIGQIEEALAPTVPLIDLNYNRDLLSKRAIDSLYLPRDPGDPNYDPARPSRLKILPPQEDLNGLNTPIDIKADYRIVGFNRAALGFVFGVPYVMDGQGRYVSRTGDVLPYMKDQQGNWYQRIEIPPATPGGLVTVQRGPMIVETVTLPNGTTVERPKIPDDVFISPAAPFGIGGTPQGLSAHPTETAPGPRVYNGFDKGRGPGIPSRDDLGKLDILDSLMDPPDCPAADFGSTVEVDSGAVVETHDLLSYQSLGQEQRLRLVYNSTTADARPIRMISFENIRSEMQAYLEKADPQELAISGSNRNAVLEASITFTGPGGTITTPTQYWQIERFADNVTVAIQADMSKLPSGFYNYTVNAKLFGKPRTQVGTLILDNRVDSSFGSGWSIAGLQEVHAGIAPKTIVNGVEVPGPASWLQIVDGNGAINAFQRIPETAMAAFASSYPGVVALYAPQAPASRDNGGSPPLAEMTNGTLQRRVPDGTLYVYSKPTTNAAGKPVSGKLLYVEDRYGNRTTYGRDATGKLMYIEDSTNQKTLFEYQGERVSKIIHPMNGQPGQVTVLSYNDKNLTQITDPDGTSRTFGYEDAGRMNYEKNQYGAEERDYYDQINGRAIRAVRSDNTTVEVTARDVVALKDPATTADRHAPAFANMEKLDDLKGTLKKSNGKVQKATFNERGQTIQEWDQENDGTLDALEFKRRDERGNVVESVAEDGRKTYSEFYERGNRIRTWDDESVINPVTGQLGTSFTYEGKFNRMTSMIDELGRTTTYTIDGRGDVIAVTKPDGSLWQSSYYPQGLMKSEWLTDTVTQTMLMRSTYEYDDLGRLTKLTHLDGTFSTYRYSTNDVGALQQVYTDEQGRVTTTTYDSMNRVARVEQPEITLAGGQSVKPTIVYGYDAAGNRRTTTDANGHTTTQNHDDRGRLVSVVDELGGTTTTHYKTLGSGGTDLNGNELVDWKEDALHNRTYYFYDEDDRLIVERDPQGVETHYEYVEPCGCGPGGDKPVRIITDALGRALKTDYVYDERNRMTKRINDDGTFIRYFYDAANNLIKTIDERQKVTRFEYDGLNRQTAVIHVVDGVEQVTRTYYDAMGRIIAVTDARATNPQPTQAGMRSWLKTNATGAPAYTTVSRYDALTGRLASTTNALGQTTRYTFDNVGNLLKVEDALGRITSFTYDALNRKTSVTQADPDGAIGPLAASVTLMVYDRVGNLVKETDALGRVTTHEYDELNRRTATVKTVNGQTERSETHYDAVGNITYTLDNRNRITSFKYDKLNRLIETWMPDPNNPLAGSPGQLFDAPRFAMSKRQYDASGNLQWEEDANGNRTDYLEYDRLNRLTKTRDASGAITQFGYDEAGNRTEIVDAKNQITVMAYDDRNRVVRISAPSPGPIDAAPGQTGSTLQHLPPVTVFRYDEVGNLVYKKDPRRNETTFEFDELNRLTVVTDALNHKTTTVYDEVGNVIQRIDERDKVTTYEYDDQNRLIRETRPDPDGALGAQTPPVTEFGYDAAGNKTWVKDAEGRVTLTRFDERNRAVEFADALQGTASAQRDELGRVIGWGTRFTVTSSFTYDDLGRFVASTDELGRTTTYEYDGLDRKRKVTYPDPDGAGALRASVERYDYDRQGNLKSFTDARNHTETTSYDKLNRLSETVDASGRKVTNIYDAVGNLTLQRVTPANTTVALLETSFAYDALRRVVKTTNTYLEGPNGGVRSESAFDRYDENGNRVRHIDALGRLTQYSYDELDRLSSVTDATLVVAAVRTYDAAGNLKSEADARGNTTDYEYDALNRLTRVVRAAPDTRPATVRPDVLYSYDRVGNRTSATDGEGSTTRFTYDALNRLVKVTDALGNVTTNRYDAVGNAIAIVDARGNETVMVYDRMDRLIKTTAPDPDGVAGPQKASSMTREYDANGNLVVATDARLQPTQFVYDELDRRIESIDAFGHSSFWRYDDAGRLKETEDVRGFVTKYEYDGLGRRVAVIAPPVEVTNPTTGQKVQRTDITRTGYDAVGNVVSIIDARGNETTMGYDARDRLITVTSPAPDAQGLGAKSVTRREYDANGNLTALIDPRGSAAGTPYKTTYEYDRLNRKIKTTDAEGNVTSMTYDRADQIVTTRDGRLNASGAAASLFTTKAIYDAVGRVTSIIDADGKTSSTTFDEVGNVLSTTDRLGRTTRFAYDNANRLVRRALPDPDGTGALRSPVQRFTYDVNFNLLSVQDAEQVSASYDAKGVLVTANDANVRPATEYEYDILNRQVRVTDPAGQTTLTDYDFAGNVVRVRNPRQVLDATLGATTYTYDSRNRVSTMTDAIGTVTATEYDANGNTQLVRVTSATDPLTRVSSYGYDNLNRRTSMKSPDPDGANGPQAASTTTYAYDLNGNLVSVKDPRQTLDASLGATTYTYDRMNRRLSTTDALNRTSSVTYDENGNQKTTTDARQNKTIYEYDALNRLVLVKQPSPYTDTTGLPADTLAKLPPTTSYSYDEVGNLLSTTDAERHTTAYEYDTLNRRTAMVDGRGGRSTMAYDSLGNLVESADALNQATRYEYDAANRLVKTTQADPDGVGPLASPVLRYAYDAAGNLTSTFDARNNETRYAYDAVDRRIATQLIAAGNPAAQTTKDALGRDFATGDAAVRLLLVKYDGFGNMIESRDELNRVRSFEYDALDRLVRSVAPASNGFNQLPALVTTYAYDLNSNLVLATQLTAPANRATAYEYDALNRRVKTIEDAGGSLQRSTSQGFDEVGNVAYTEDALQKRTVFSYDAMNRRTKVVDARNQTATLAYDLVGNVTRTVDASGRKTDYRYDELNRRVAVIDNKDQTATMSYDAVGNLKSTTDVLQRTTSFEYDRLNRRVSATMPDPDAGGSVLASTIGYAYDAAGNLTSTTDARGFTTTFEYDARNQRTRVTDPRGGITQSFYDAAGNRIAVSDPIGRITRFAYDSLNRAIASAQPDPAGSNDAAKGLVTSYEYDQVGNLIKTTDPLGHFSTQAYDVLNRRIESVDANLAKTAYEYTARNELKALVDPSLNRTAYLYDELGRMTSQTDALGVRSFDYDEIGNVTRSVDARGLVIEKHYDELSRNDVETWRDQTNALQRTITRTFDAAGQLRTVTDPDATYTIDYDRMGRMVSIDNQGAAGLPAVKLSYGYDASSNLTLTIATIGGVENWRTVAAHDELNRTTSLRQFGGSAVDKRVEYTYDAASQLKALERFDATGAAADVTTTMDYDGAGRTKSITHSAGANTVAAYTYVWDAASRLRGMTSPDGPNVYTYDDRNQLTGADYSSTSGNPADQTFAWDANGNPVRAGVTVGTGNRVLSDETSTYAYDAEGNRTRKTDKATGGYTEYVWDHRNRLTGATEHTSSGTVTGTQSYRYDDFGWKVGATRDADGAGGQAAVTESYIHDRDDISMVFNGSGQLTELMLHGPGMDAVLSEQRGNQLRWSLADHQNSVRDVVGANGQAIDHIVYDSFGKISSQTQAGQSPRFGYTGRELDMQTGLMDYRARWYDNSLGRFVSRDPIGFAAGDANLYRYVSNRPLDRMDPTGNSELGSVIGQTIRQTAYDIAIAPVKMGVAGVAGTTHFGVTFVTGIADLAWFGFDTAVFAGEAVAGRVFENVHGVTGSEWSKRLSDTFYDSSINKIKAQLNNPCAGALDAFIQAPTTISPSKGLTTRWDEQVAELRKVMPEDLRGSLDVGVTVANVAGLFVDPFMIAGAAGKLSKGFALAERFAEGAQGLSKVSKATDLERSVATAGKLETAMSASRGERAIAEGSRGAAAASNTERATQLNRGAGEVRNARVAEQAQATARTRESMRIDYEIRQMQEARNAAEAKRAATSDAASGMRQEMEASGLTPKTAEVKQAWLTKGIEPPRYTGIESVLANTTPPKPKSFTDGVSDAIKNWSMEKWGPVSGATERQQAVIKAFAKENNLEIAIRATDRVTAAGTGFGVARGWAGKPEAVKAKSVLGLLKGPDGQWLRSDLDLGWVRDRTTGKYLTNDDILTKVVDPLNRKLMQAGDAKPSIYHGAHFTMGAEKGGYVSRAEIAKIGDPGPVNVFTGDGMTTLKNRNEVRIRVASTDGGLQWAEGWKKSTTASYEGARTFYAERAGDYRQALKAAEESRAARMAENGSAVSRAPASLATPPMRDPLELDLDALIASTPVSTKPEMVFSDGRYIPASELRVATPGVPTPAPSAARQAQIDQVLEFANSEQLRRGHIQTSMGGVASPNPVSLEQVPDELRIAEMVRRADAMQVARVQARGVAGTLAEDGITFLFPPIKPNGNMYMNPEWVVAQGGVAPGKSVALPERVFAPGQLDADGGLSLQYFRDQGAHLQLDNVPLPQPMPLTNVAPPGSVAGSGGRLAAGDRGGATSAAGSPGITAALSMVNIAGALWTQAAEQSGSGNWRLSIADLPAGQLGQAYITQLDANGKPSEGRIVLDVNADGHGWFVDPTPLDASEFSDPNSAAAGKYDLFTVIAHELGHTLGFLSGYAGFDRYVTTTADGSKVFTAPGVRVMLTNDGNHLSDSDHAGDLMADSLGLFQRKLPSQLDAAILAATLSGGLGTGTTTDVQIGPANVNADPPPVGITNGSFGVSDAILPTFGWSATGGASVVNGQGVLSENPSLASRLSQSFTLPASSKTLSFKLTGAQFKSNGSGPQDAFEVALLDPSTMSALGGVVGLSGTDALLNIQADGTVRAGAAVTVSGLVGGKLPADLFAPVTVTIDLSGLPAGQAATIYFDLLGLGSLGSQVTIDDVAFDANQAPTLAAVAPITVNEGSTITVPLVSSDPEGDAITYVLDAAPAGATIDAQGRITWAAVDGPASAVFTVRAVDSKGASSAARSFTVNVVNVSPTFTVEVPTTIRAGEAFSIKLSATDPGTDTISQWRIDWGDGTQSTVAGTATSTGHTYAAALTAAVITVQAIDEDGTWTAPVITREVLPVNPPVNHPPIARADSALTLRNQPVTIDVLANDAEPDGQAMTAEAVTQPAHGALTRDTAGRFIYTPTFGYVGADSFSYRAGDGQLFSDPVTVEIKVSAVNDAPVAAGESYSTPRDTAKVLAVLGNDNDPNGDALSVVVVSGPAHGALVTNPDGTLTYTPALGYSGPDSFSYRASDGLLQSDAVIVSLAVTPVNHPPVLAPVANASVLEGTIHSVALIGTDADGNALTYVLDQAPPGASIDAAGVVRWNAVNGPAVGNFTAHAVDAAGASSAPVSFVITVANVAPVIAVSAPATVRAGTPVTLSLSATDPGADTISQWLIDWGDGTQSGVAGAGAGAAVNASHTYSAARAATGIVVRAVDADGTWTAPTVTREVLPAASAPSQRPRVEDDGRGRQKERERESRERDSERERSESDSRRPRLETRAAERPGFNLGVDLIDQTAHRSNRVVAVVVADGRPGINADGSAPLTAEAMQALIESNPTAAGVAGPSSTAALQINSMVATELGLRVRFNQALAAAALQAASGSALLLMRGDQVVPGKLVIDPDGEGLRFDTDAGTLPAGEYRVLLRSDSGAFVTPEGSRLDGDYDGRAGGDFQGRFTVPVSAGLGAADASSELSYEAQAIKDYADIFAALSGGWGGAMSAALGPLANNRRRRGRTMCDQAVRVEGLDRLHTEDLDFAVQAVVPTAVAAQAGRARASANDWEIRI